MTNRQHNPEFAVQIIPTAHTVRNGHDLVIWHNAQQSWSKSDLTDDELIDIRDTIQQYLHRTERWVRYGNCDHCGAPPGEPCVSDISGHDIVRAHPDRSLTTR